jgi:outer membrane protein OmpA-like peptidoglycan-associated protein
VSGSRRLVGWAVAAVAVPAALAAIGLAWVQAPPGPAPPAALGTTPSGQTPVAAAAGVEAQVAALLAATPLLFDGERAELRPSTAATVDRLAALLAAAPEAAVRLVGHTADLPGPEGRAVALSRERGEAVAERLALAGVAPGRIAVEGVGDADPLATPEASRRVEVLVG